MRFEPAQQRLFLGQNRGRFPVWWNLSPCFSGTWPRSGFNAAGQCHKPITILDALRHSRSWSGPASRNDTVQVKHGPGGSAPATGTRDEVNDENHFRGYAGGSWPGSGHGFGRHAGRREGSGRTEVRCFDRTGRFAAPDANGEWGGFDVVMCRAVAAAVLGDANAVKFVPTTGKTRFTALASGEVDMLARNTTWTFSRDVDLGFEFVGVNYYDGQGFMVPKNLGVTSPRNSTVRPSASRPVRRPSSTWPTSSAPTT